MPLGKTLALRLGVKLKDWLKIGEFSKKVGLTPKALRVYEVMGLICAHQRGENNYRYYSLKQVEIVQKIKQFRKLGFSLNEIKSLLDYNSDINSELLAQHLQRRLDSIKDEKSLLKESQKIIEEILTSLSDKKTALSQTNRRYIMKQFDKTSVIICGIRGLDETAEFIKEHFKSCGKSVPVLTFSEALEMPNKPYVLVIKEKDLEFVKKNQISADIVVIKEISKWSEVLENNYLKLFDQMDDTRITVFNGDDRALLGLAANKQVQKGRIYYFSKNNALKEQIRKIGGVVSDSEEIEFFGFNLSCEQFKVKIGKPLGLEEENSYLASLVAVMEFGIDPGQLYKV